jgi:hypothetical protein
MPKSYVYRLWGKTEPYNSLICHMIDVGCTAQALLANSCFEGLRSKLIRQMGDLWGHALLIILFEAVHL